MESWRKTFREGFAPFFSTESLIALKSGLESNDSHLIQGSTTEPPPLMCTANWAVNACCAIGYCGWKGNQLKTVEEVEKFFAEMCFKCDSQLGEPAACRWFLNWFDETPRKEVFKLLAEEINTIIQERENKWKKSGTMSMQQ